MYICTRIPVYLHKQAEEADARITYLCALGVHVYFTHIPVFLHEQAEEADVRITYLHEENHARLERKEERIKQLIEDLDESRQSYLKVVSELSERVIFL